jgi:hypothetical protein
MSFTYRFRRAGVFYEHHGEVLDDIVGRAMTDIDQQRADPLEIRDGGKVLLNVQDINDLWIDRSEKSYWAI